MLLIWSNQQEHFGIGIGEEGGQNQGVVIQKLSEASPESLVSNQVKNIATIESAFL